MKISRLFSACALLTLGACGSPRGNTSSTSGDPDASTSSTTDAVAAVDAATRDITAAPDVLAPIDVPGVPDVPSARCGDGTCNEGESCESCRSDCASTCPPPVDVPTARCGDGTCNGTETCTSCAGDCGPCTSTGALTDPCAAGATQGPDRNCGWRTGTTFTCSPGRATMVGCSGTEGAGSLCQPAYGACVGDPVMRVCPGTTPCAAAMALMPSAGSFDDQCGTCPSAYVTCPASGQIHVLTGDYDSTNAAQRGTCTAAVR